MLSLRILQNYCHIYCLDHYAYTKDTIRSTTLLCYTLQFAYAGLCWASPTQAVVRQDVTFTLFSACNYVLNLNPMVERFKESMSGVGSV